MPYNVFSLAIKNRLLQSDKLFRSTGFINRSTSSAAVFHVIELIFLPKVLTSQFWSMLRFSSCHGPY